MMKADPDAAGLDATRLNHLDRHLRERYVDAGKIAGCQTLVARRGQVGYFSSLGLMDIERAKPVEDDTIWRIYSMTKPITGVALLTLYEQGHFQLNDPVHRFIPEWRGQKVGERAPDGSLRLVEPHRAVTIRDVMMHTAGLGYGPGNADLDIETLRAPERAGPVRRDATLEDLALRLAGEPLRFHPGTQWLYSLGTDVCARLVEIISGRRFDDYLRTVIFDPLGMKDTGFAVPDAEIGRFAANYRRNDRKQLVLLEDPERSSFRSQPSMLSGGGGLVSTSADYLRFAQMLVNGGELDGVRILSRKTVQLMSSNHLPGGADLTQMSLPGGYGEVGMDGMGFGLTVAVNLGPVATQAVGSAGAFMWGGAASTTFWVDPAEDLVVIFMTQLVPSGTFNFPGQLKTVVYGALSD
jgi:CubicO group peptidase (beta-lactamase class C family)